MNQDYWDQLIKIRQLFKDEYIEVGWSHSDADSFAQKDIELVHKNKEAWRFFEKHAIEIYYKQQGLFEKARGLGVQAVLDEVRRKDNLNGDKKEYYINNNLSPLFARIYNFKHPDHKNFINTKKFTKPQELRKVA